MKNIKPIFKNLLCGSAIGASMLVPGISGGTTAIILGIYDSLVNAVSELFENFRKNFFYLLTVLLGGALGAFLFSGMLLHIIDLYYIRAMYFFTGAILGSVPLMVKKAEISCHNIYCILFSIPGLLTAIGIGFIPEINELSGINGPGNIALRFVCGLIVAIALILPGISTSHILLVLGMYEPILKSITGFDLYYVFPIVIGCTTGILVGTRLLDKAMKRFPSQTFMMIAGFVMASVYDIFPGNPTGTEQAVCILLSLAGFGTVAFVALKAKNESE